MNHILLFFFIITIIFCGTNVLCSVLVTGEKAPIYGNAHLAFSISLFIYTFLDIVFYYKGYVIKSSSVSAVFSFLIALFLAAYNCLWITFSCKTLKINCYKRFCIGLSSVYCLLWLLKSVFFIDGFYDELFKTGNIISTVAEILVICMFIVFDFRIIEQALALEKGSHKRQYIFSQSLLLVLYFIYYIISSILFLSGVSNLKEWPALTYLIDILILFLISINAVLYLIKTSILHGAPAEKDSSHVNPISDPKVFERVFQEYGLSAREQEVFLLLMEGASNQSISEKLYISINTTKKHINSIYRKLDVNSRISLIELIIKETNEINLHG